MSEPIATRTLRIERPEGRVDVPIRIFAPEPADEAWSCRYEIGWPGRTKQMSVHGIDAVQALELALMMIGADLYASAYHEAGQLVYQEPGAGYGFPVPASIRDLLQGDDAEHQ